MQQALTKQRHLCTSIHRAFDFVELGDLPFNLPIALRSNEGRFHSRSITLNPPLANWRSSRIELV
jgi:hypothetical protein